MAVYFTSDLHFGHNNAIKNANRPFSSLEEMEKVLLKNINTTVKSSDTLYILGDFSFKISQVEAEKIAKKIRCKHVHLIKGNHDKSFDGTGVFSSVSDYKELKINDTKLVLFHYQINGWNGKHRGSIHLHGHIHSDGSYNAENAKQGNRIYDVGVDANNFKPVLLENILAFMGIDNRE